MENPYNDDLPMAHTIVSVPAVISEEKKGDTYTAPQSDSQTKALHQGAGDGYQKLENSSEGDGAPPANNWQGVFSISSYTQYFNVDTDIVLDRALSSLDPLRGDFFRQIDANRDLYGPFWVSTTLVFAITFLGNLATNLRHGSSWSFNVSYVSLAASLVYGYAVMVPLGFYFLLQYLGSNPSLVRFWCMWGYSLFVLIICSDLLVIPVEFLRWMMVVVTGGISACFVTSNLNSYIQEENIVMLFLGAALVLQLAFGLFIKIYFFP